MLKGKLSMLVMLTVLLTFVMAGCYKKTPEQRAEDMVQHLVTNLDLNDVQKAKLEKIKDEMLARRPEMIALQEETVKEANALMRSPQVDQTKLNALLDKNQKRIDEYARFIAAKFTEIHDMLTPEQRDKLVALVEKHMRH